MTCYHPNFIVKHRIHSPGLRLQYRYEDKKGVSRNGWKMMKEGAYEYKFFTGYDFDKFKNSVEIQDYEVETLPCGCCVGCRLDYSRQWANRCYLESLQWKDNYFVTLTYNEDNKRIGKYGNATLEPDDIKKFIKDLRAYWKYHYDHDNIRFFLCGEYGDLSLRPHYHIIFFNLPIPDISEEFVYEDENGEVRRTRKCQNGVVFKWSEEICKIWSKGNIVIEEANWRSMAYTARYVMKKIKGVEGDVYEKLGIVPEFVRMSRMPGLGQEYFLQHHDEIYKNDNLVVFNGTAQSVQPPRYFDNLVKKFELSDIDLEVIKAYRKEQSKVANVTNDYLSDLSYLDLLDALEEDKNRQIVALKRVI